MEAASIVSIREGDRDGRSFPRKIEI